MKLIDTRIPDVKIIEPAVFGDARGFFMETWSAAKFAELGLELNFVQDNHSRSRQGILRGLHYQVQQAQGKLVRVTSGKVFDVAVDLRRSSATFGQWVGAELSDENHRMMWVPPGFAHGFYVMSESADFLYKCTDVYAPHHERCIRWDDPTLAIDWPLVDGQTPLVSAKDAEGKSWQDAEVFK
ncbi:MAG: dTDP-4-dehydrorhamnose 3,5-epimerase [Gammaproteobacteria bacterium]|nr:dTDP-4-dehydrorhamnose 3,5-epimerase [Gammaproteobacteria bacterium]MBU1722914.1 dTDP-4-dehydrorhamnose 3,5-epimerase [Gammaproteobacteria bacterium]MBU2005709.1 dTDP-4-dehydrorhamnose 3,5-epimerase [Gammaproteobacteria bacterium]